jgi:hypothetical protein
MKIIPRFFHGIADYASGLLLLMGPNLFGFDSIGGGAAWVPRSVGILILLQAMTTDYELGLMKIIPISMHLTTDYLVGAVLLVAPWFFGFAVHRAATILLTVTGLMVLGLTAMTEPKGRPRNVMA